MRRHCGRGPAAWGVALLGMLAVVLAGPPLDARGGCGVRRGGWTSLSWPSFSTGLRTATSFAVDAAGRKLFVTNGRAVLRSLDRGCAWGEVYALPQQHTPGAPFTRFDSEITAVVVSPVAVYLSIRQDAGTPLPHVVRSVDGGTSWEVADAGLRPTESRPLAVSTALGRPVALATAPSRPEVVYLLLDGPAGPSLWASGDGGAQWRARHRGPRQEAGYRGLTVDPRAAGRLWLWSGDGVFAGTGGGRQVEPVAALPAGTDVGWMQVVHLAGGRPRLLVFSGESLDMFRSTDGGRTFATFLAPGVVASSAAYAWTERRGEPVELSVLAARNGVYRQIAARGPPAFEDVSPDDRRPIVEIAVVARRGGVAVVGRTDSTIEVLLVPLGRRMRSLPGEQSPKRGQSIGHEQIGHLRFGKLAASGPTRSSGSAAGRGGMRVAARTWPDVWYSVRVTGP